jgi:hypothetical protein
METGDGIVIIAVKDSLAKPARQSLLHFKLSLVIDEEQEAIAAERKMREERQWEIEKARRTEKAATVALNRAQSVALKSFKSQKVLCMGPSPSSYGVWVPNLSDG